MFSDAGQSYRVLEANSDSSQLGSRARSSDKSTFGFEVDLGGQYLHTKSNPYPGCSQYGPRGQDNESAKLRADSLLKDMFPNPLTGPPPSPSAASSVDINKDAKHQIKHKMEPKYQTVLWTGDQDEPWGEWRRNYHRPSESVWVDSTYG